MRRFCLSLALLQLGAMGVWAQGITVHEATTYPAKAGEQVLVALILDNPAAVSAQLVGLTSPVAARATLRQHGVVEGVSQMETVRQVELAPRSRTKLLPGATDVLLAPLQQDLLPGTEFPLFLTLQPSTTLTARVRVLRDLNSTP